MVYGSLKLLLLSLLPLSYLCYHLFSTVTNVWYLIQNICNNITIYVLVIDVISFEISSRYIAHCFTGELHYDVTDVEVCIISPVISPVELNLN
jgi:hypothetical protein